MKDLRSVAYIERYVPRVLIDSNEKALAASIIAHGMKNDIKEKQLKATRLYSGIVAGAMSLNYMMGNPVKDAMEDLYYDTIENSSLNVSKAADVL